MHLDWQRHAPRTVYHVFGMRVPCTGVRPCMAVAVPHKKLHIGSLSHLSNQSVCMIGLTLGLLTTCLASVEICLLGFHSVDSRTWGFHALVSGHAWLSPMRNHTVSTIETAHWKSVAPLKWISMHILRAPSVAYLMFSIS